MAKVVKNERLENQANQSKEFLRLKRKKLLEAFDILKTNVSVDLEKIDDLHWSKIVEWYEDLKDLKPESFEEENIPNAVKHYIQ